MTRRQSTIEAEQNYREVFLARLCRLVAVPSEQWPTVRWWKLSALTQLFGRVRDELIAEGYQKGTPIHVLLDWLTRLGLVQAFAAEGETFYLLEMGAAVDSATDPFELLMAVRPAGVICYFSAVAFHSLTTQPVAHHHVAELKATGSATRKENSSAINEALAQADEVEHETPSVPSLGVLLFKEQGIPFYSTRRSTRLMPGVQLRGYGPRSQLRITTLEQTLLDTLSKPFHCGGPEVVFEAWREGLHTFRMEEERLSGYLQAMNYPATTRRVGAVLELFSYIPGRELGRQLEDAQARMDRSGPFSRISLLPGIDYEQLNDRWLVNMP